VAAGDDLVRHSVTVTFHERDYRFGAGPLTVRLQRVDRSRPASREHARPKEDALSGASPTQWCHVVS